MTIIHNNLKAADKNYPVIFSALTFLLLLFSFVFAVSKEVWVLEVMPILLGFPVLFFTYKRFKFTSLAYVLLVIHFIIICVGAIYTYAEVPLGYWMKEWFGFARNNYDKIGHFAQGFIPAIIIREVLLRTSPLRQGKWLGFIVASICLAISALYEIAEWWSAVALKTSAEAFLGLQGYEWDSQSDMFFALIGAIAALLLLSKLHDKLLKVLETR